MFICGRKRGVLVCKVCLKVWPLYFKILIAGTSFPFVVGVMSFGASWNERQVKDEPADIPQIWFVLWYCCDGWWTSRCTHWWELVCHFLTNENSYGLSDLHRSSVVQKGDAHLLCKLVQLHNLQWTCAVHIALGATKKEVKLLTIVSITSCDPQLDSTTWLY